MGLGYIGLPTVIIVTKHGMEIVGVNINAQMVKATNQGKLYIIRPGMEEMLREVLASGHFKTYTRPRASDAYFMVVPTPYKGDREPDISFAKSATHMVLPLLREEDLYVIESTSPVGAIERMTRLIFLERPELEGKIYITYCPERVLPDSAIHKLMHNGRAIGGMDEASTHKTIEFYGQFVKGMLHPTNSKTIEMCKLTENSSRDIQIVFANELSLICDKAGINVWELIDLASKHLRVNILRPGCGINGHCIAVDPYFITTEFPMESRMISTARKTNNYRAFWCAEKMRNTMLRFKLEREREPTVAMMGLAFRPDTDDLRESPAKEMTTKVLQSCDSADIMVVKPNVSEHKLFKLAPYEEAYGKMDIMVFLVNHREFTGLSYRDDMEVLSFCGTFKK